jgi:tetratricopeptide (TPR) repeat protein
MRVLSIAILIVLCSSLSIQAEEEFIVLRDNSTIRGDVVKVDQESITVQLPEGAEMGILFESMEPTSAYRIRAKYMDKKDATAHLELGNWSIDQQLWYYARKELKKAAELDGKLEAEVGKRLEELAELEAKYYYEKGIEMAQAEQFQEALNAFRNLREKYPDSKYAKQAQEELKTITATIQKKNEEREKQLAELKRKQEQEKQKKISDGEQSVFDAAIKDVDRAKSLNKEGLRSEGGDDLSRAIKKWEEADLLLSQTKVTLADLGKKSKDVTLLDQIKTSTEEVEGLQVIVAMNLGQLYARSFNISQAIKWINKVLEMDPTNAAATQLKLTLIQEQYRRRW